MSVYACSDLHGHFNIYNLIKNFIAPEDKVYCLGDCGDRGPEGWKTIQAVYHDPQFIYLRGNHEDMTARAMRSYNSGSIYNGAIALSVQNGGRSTLDSWIDEGADFSWYHRLMDLPVNAKYIRNDGKIVFLNHSGASEYSTVEDQLWSRNHFWAYKSDSDFTVHGHTPIPFLIDELAESYNFYNDEGSFSTNWKVGEPFTYCDGRKICLDNGTFYTGQATLLNLDTFGYITFVDQEGDIAE